MSAVAVGAGLVRNRRFRSAARLVAWSAWGAMVALVVGGILIWVGSGQPALPISFAHGGLGVAAISACAAVFTTLGTVLAARLPWNAIGWLLLTVGMLFAFLTPVNLVIEAAFEVARPVPAPTLFIAWLMSSGMTPTIAFSMLTLCVVFPDGRVPPGRWWACVALACVGSLLLAVASGVEPTGLIWYPTLPNPYAAPAALGPAIGALRIAALLALVAAGIVAAAAMTRRYREADERVRGQLHWILFGVGAMTAGLLPMLVARYALAIGDEAGEVLLALAAAAVCTFPLAVALAIVRQRLFDMDRLISATLVYVPLMGILAGVYTASVTLFQRVFVSLTSNTSDAAIVLSALVLASVFAPIRSNLEARVARRFHPATPAPVAGSTPAAGPEAVAVERSFGEPMPVAPVPGPAPARSARAAAVAPAPAPDLTARVAELEAALRELRERERS